MSTYINVTNSNGTNFEADDVRTGAFPARWLEDGIDDRIIDAMDDEIREQVHGELAPCTPREFLARYLELATEPLVIG